MTEWAKAGALKPLDDVLDVATYKAETAPALVELGTVDGKISGVFIKAAVKGLIWYNPRRLHRRRRRRPGTRSRSRPHRRPADKLWCVGLESGAASGWPGTDWIEDFVLRQSGPGRLRRLGRRDAEVDRRPRSSRRSRPSATVVDNTYGGSRRGPDHQLRRRRQPAVHRSARLPVPPPGELHHRLLQEPGRRAGRAVRLLPDSRTSTRVRGRRRPAPATCSGCSTTPRRPAP